MKENASEIENTYLKDTSLTLQAKGLLAYLKAYPEARKMNVAEWTSISRNGRDSTTNALKELIAAEYVEKIQNREDGQFSYSEVILHLIK